LEPNNTNQIILNDGGTPNALSNTINYSSMTISDALDTLTIDKTNITHSNATTALTITSTGVNKDINIDTIGAVYIGDAGAVGNGVNITIDNVNQTLALQDPGSTYLVINFLQGIIDLNGRNGVNIEAGNGSGVGNINLRASDPTTGKVNVDATLGVVINKQGVVLPDTIITTLTGGSIEIFDDQNLTTGIINQVLLDPNGGLFTDNTDNTLQTQSYFRGSPTYMEIYDHTASGSNTSRIEVTSETFEYFRSGTKPTFYDFRCGGGSVFRMNTTGINMGSGGTGVQLNANNIKYPTSYNTTNQNITTSSNAVQTFNGTNLTATLFTVTASNVGTQFTITNTNTTALTVIGNGVQSIYSSTGVASATSRTLAQGHSQIFTAIQTTGASTFGWSMV
jgi:hypothetical protein